MAVPAHTCQHGLPQLRPLHVSPAAGPAPAMRPFSALLMEHCYICGHGALIILAVASLLAGGVSSMLADLFWLRNRSMICTVRAAILV